jgi:hypothetical protein
LPLASSIIIEWQKKKSNRPMTASQATSRVRTNNTRFCEEVRLLGRPNKEFPTLMAAMSYGPGLKPDSLIKRAGGCYCGILHCGGNATSLTTHMSLILLIF